MPRTGTALLLCALLAASAAQAQSEMADRLSKEQMGDVEPGAYSAGRTAFTLDSYGDKYLLRFSDNSEIYVLYADPAPLGGRVLKYDSGAVAIRVAGWGGMTLYTDAAPGGVPAERTGDSLPPAPAQISLYDVQNAAEDEAEHLAYSRRIHLSFNADWSALAGDTRRRERDVAERGLRLGLDRRLAG